MMVTAKRIPVPEPMAPRKSAITDSPPIQRPPKAAAVGMYLQEENQLYTDIQENNFLYAAGNKH